MPYLNMVGAAWSFLEGKVSDNLRGHLGLLVLIVLIVQQELIEDLEHPVEPTNHQQTLFNHNNPHERPLETPHVEDWSRHSALFHTSWPHSSSSIHSPQNNLQSPDWDNIHVLDSPQIVEHYDPPSLVTSPKSTEETTTKPLRKNKNSEG